MVLTRAQAAAAAAAPTQENEVPHVETAIVERVGADLISPSALPFVPHVADHLANLAQHFIAQTQALAAEHVQLQQQQQGHSHAQNEALMAMQVSTEANIRLLTDQQRAIVQSLGEALTATQSSLQNQLHHLKKAHDERGGQMEQFVNDRVAQALQDVQQESQREASSQIEGVRRTLGEIETKVNSGLENLSQYFQHLVEDKVAASRHQTITCDDATLLIQKEIEAAASSIASSVKTSLQQDLQITCNAMRQELLARVDSAEEPHREYVRSVVMEITGDAERRLEARMQRALTNTKSELNLQVQRQTDATLALREQVRKLSVRSKRQAQRNEEGVLETTIADLVQKEVEQRFNAQQVSGPFRPDNNTHLQQEMQTQIQDSHNSIDRTIQSAVGIIQRTIRDEVRCAAIEGIKQIKVQQPNQGNQGDELDGGEFSTDEDSEVEKRMQEAWRRSYMHASPSAPVTLPTNTDIDVPYVVEENTPTTLLLEKDPPSTVEEETKETSPPMTELPRLHRMLSQPPPPNSVMQQQIESNTHTQQISRGSWHQRLSQSPPTSNAVMLQRIPTDTHTQRLSRQSRTQNLDLSVIVSEIQLQVQERAEQAAQRYQSSRSHEE